jgi:hypothetical protein
LIFAAAIRVRRFTNFVAFEKQHLGDAFVRVDFRRQRCRIREFERDVPFPFRLERRDVDDDPATRISGFAQTHGQDAARNAEILHRASQRERIRRDDADIALEVDKRLLVKVLRIDDRRVDIGENLEFVGAADVIAVARRAVADNLPAVFGNADLIGCKRLDHIVRLGHAPDPLVGFDSHR